MKKFYRLILFIYSMHTFESPRYLIYICGFMIFSKKLISELTSSSLGTWSRRNNRAVWFGMHPFSIIWSSLICNQLPSLKPKTGGVWTLGIPWYSEIRVSLVSWIIKTKWMKIHSFPTDPYLTTYPHVLAGWIRIKIMWVDIEREEAKGIQTNWVHYWHIICCTYVYCS